ncbi:motile sperm domain-containing protein 1-like [Sitophilus oryzae]|uniref:Motile sperm domain-containing protein 1-like n=1 Tax=Sitophilus oryzae TaxID=7048 RepID=A0A6J2Y1N9_SITOR|nr:motile sperm domain-containing protein 1-like [Sitophilus oryzae]
MNLNFRQIPVFAFPNSLKFYLGTKSSYTQVLTLYSPYDFPIKYKVHCHTSAWDKYIVPNPEGTIPPQSSVDLVITHKQAVPSNCNIMDKFKIVIQDTVTDQIIGKKTIESILLAEEKDSRYNNEDFEFQSSHDSSNKSVQGSQVIRNVHHIDRSSGNSVMSSLIIVVCAVVLFLPTEPEITKSSSLPSYLHVSHKIQLLAALLLGVFLCILVRS